MQALGSRRKKIYRRLTEGVMSSLYGKWNVEDVRDVIHGLDEKTGMDGASISIFMSKKLGDGSTLGSYHPSKDHKWRGFSFSLSYFDDSSFKDLAAIDVIRHEYCHYLVDALGLKDVFDDDSDHGIAWKTVCGLLNTIQRGTYSDWDFCKATEESFMNAYMSEDIRQVDIMEQINRWGTHLPSIRRRRYLEKELIKKYTKLRVFKNEDRVIHEKYGQGTVIDTLPSVNKQFLYVEFDNGVTQIVQNRKVYKLVNGKVKKPVSRASKAA